MAIDGVAAARTLKGYAPLSRHGACLYYVWQAYDAHGADTQRSAPTAYRAWQLSDGKHVGDRNPPAGVPVWWGRRRSDGNMDGDVVISLGGGRVVATDQPTWGQVSETTIDGREKLIGREYLGWTECIFDAPISLPKHEEEGIDMTKVTMAYNKFIGRKIDGDWGYLWLNDKHDTSVAIGPIDVLSGTLAIAIKTTKLVPATAAFQVRAVIETWKDGKTVGEPTSLGAYEVHPTTGDALSQLPISPVHIGSGKRLRFQIASTDGLAGEVVRATYRAAHVKA